MSKKTILFVSHTKAQCGVYEFGNTVSQILERSQKFRFVRAECNSMADLQKAIAEFRPDAIIYNYHTAVMPWIATPKAPRLFKNNIAHIPLPQIGIIHEITQQVADTATNYRKKFVPLKAQRLANSLFDYYIAPDPTLLLKNPLVYKTGRLIAEYENNFPLPSKPTIGSFGFGTPKKGFEKIVTLVQQEFDEAIIRLNIPSADFGDKNGISAKAIAAKCQSMITKPGIELNITHDFLDHKAMLDFLAQNTINVFLYEDTGGRGLSSATDNAMAVKRPIAVSDSVMFRHLHHTNPAVCITSNTLKQIIQNGFTPLQQSYDEWSEAMLLWEYERIVDAVFRASENPVSSRMGVVRTVQSAWNRTFSKPDKTFTWLRNSDQATEDDLKADTAATYQPIKDSAIHFNRILDNQARALYQPAINKLMELAPKTMAKKIPEANVQQAFVFDTVYRHLKNYDTPKLLCVGSYEDTASMGLIKMGYEVAEIDPMINYFLQEYYTKPNIRKNTYDIIFSTSVIEHDPNDQSFMQCIEGLLAPGGIAVITCDYKDGWKPGEPKPEVDARFYTQKDLKERLLSYIPSCTLVDEPNWECPNPDFHYLGKYNYTFATFVVKKNK